MKKENRRLQCVKYKWLSFKSLVLLTLCSAGFIILWSFIAEDTCRLFDSRRNVNHCNLQFSVNEGFYSKLTQIENNISSRAENGDPIDYLVLRFYKNHMHRILYC